MVFTTNLKAPTFTPPQKKLPRPNLLVARRASVGAGPLPAHSALVPRARRGVARGPEEAADVEGLKVAEKVRQVHPVRPALLLQARREPGLVPKALRPAVRGLGEAALPAGDAPRIPELKQAHVIHLGENTQGGGGPRLKFYEKDCLFR